MPNRKPPTGDLGVTMMLAGKFKAADAQVREATMRLREACSRPSAGPKTLMDHVRDVEVELADLHAANAQLRAEVERLEKRWAAAREHVAWVIAECEGKVEAGSARNIQNKMDALAREGGAS